MKNLLIILLPLLFAATMFSSCQKDNDPCEAVSCFNGGVCQSGTCDCPPGYSGSDCATALTPISMTITRIDVTDYPIVQSSGAGWDVSDGADPFVTFNSGTSSNQNDFVSGRYTDVTGQDLTYTNGLPITIPSLSSNWVLGIWDYDATSNNDFMAGVYFAPINKVNGFPSSFQVNTSSLTATFYVTWNF